jgi:hypothetical protein
MNKKLIIAFVSSLIISTAFSQGKFKFDSESHDFGIVTEGEMATHEFNFKNIGDQPIVLKSFLRLHYTCMDQNTYNAWATR